MSVTEQAIDNANAAIDRARQQLAFASPEMYVICWQRLAEDIEDIIREALTGLPWPALPPPSPAAVDVRKEPR